MNDLEADNLEQIIKENSKVFVQFGAGWCGNCRMIKPKIKNLASEYEGVHFVYADAEKYPGSRKLAQVDNLPTYAIYKDGELIEQTQGNKIELVQELADKLK